LFGMTPAKAFAAVALAATTMLLTAGCGSGRGIFGEIHDVSIEVTGTGGPATEVTYRLPSGDGSERNVRLPWTKSAASEFFPVTVRVVPAPGATVTCRIVVDGREVSSAAGRASTVGCSKERLDS
jgi:hypothetical protein